MQYVCDTPDGKTWFRIETEAEAAAESDIMNHGVEKHFRQAREKASESYKPVSQVLFEQNIGLAAHLQRVMPTFLTLREHPRAHGRHSAGPGLYIGQIGPFSREPPRGLLLPAYSPLRRPRSRWRCARP